ncbi:Growth hormone-inducible transmembrane protein [Orchesella cincta]|uniref:Growth hormone-inducible transmembrane protein n=1 Tax=Orchesella cincta TaxID=48709 RepID=A0A1D2M0J8_ORCCI|nr:Growth hormone-inducible transmembrane protein [Orchesella cincta]
MRAGVWLLGASTLLVLRGAPFAIFMALWAVCLMKLDIHVSVGPEFVRQRIKDTYQYFVFTAASAMAHFQISSVNEFDDEELLGRDARKYGSDDWNWNGGSKHALYTEGFGAKQIGWMVHSGVIGVVLAATLSFWEDPCSSCVLYDGWRLLRSICHCVAVRQGSMFGFLQQLLLGLDVFNVIVRWTPPVFRFSPYYDTQRIINTPAETVPLQIQCSKYDPINCTFFIRMPRVLAHGLVDPESGWSEEKLSWTSNRRVRACFE